MNCPNWKHPDMQVLVDKLGKDDAYIAYIKNGDTAPSLDKAYKLLNLEKGAASSNTTISKEVQENLKSFLEKRGIHILNYTRAEAREYLDILGLSKKAMMGGVADTAQGLIGLLDGREDVSFPEEAGHMTFAMLKGVNPKLAKEMFDKIVKCNIYQKVLRDPGYVKNPLYRKDGKLNIEAIKEEAIGKLLKEHLAHETGQISRIGDFETGLLDAESPETVSFIQRWFDKAKQFFKQLFNKYDDNPFREVAKQMLGTSKNKFKGDASHLTEDNLKLANMTPDFVDSKIDLLKAQNKATSFFDGKFKFNDKDVRFKPDDSKIGLKNTKGSREVEERGHLDITDIFGRYIGEDGVLRVKPLDKLNKSNLDPIKEEAYAVLEQNMAERLAELEAKAPGTKFMHSVNIYNGGDKADVNGKAARIDLIAITPEGRASVYNFEFMRHGLNISDTDIPLEYQNASRAYMNDVKGILSKGYGIKQFDESRTIPIKITLNSSDNGRVINYEPNSLEIAGKKTVIGSSSYLHPIPTFDERTGDPAINALIDKFADLYEAKSKGTAEGRKDIMGQIANTIRHMQVEKGVPLLTEQAEIATAIARKATTDFMDNVSRLDPTDLSIDELSVKARALDMREADLAIYQEAYRHHKDKVKNATPEELVQLDKLRVASEKAGEALLELKDARREFAKFVAMKWNVENADAAERELSFYGRFLRPFNKPTTSMQTAFYRMKTEANTVIEHRIRDYVDKLEDIQAELKEWHKSRKYTDMLNLLKAKDEHGQRTNRLIKKYATEFYEEWAENEEMVDRGDVSGKVWMRKNIDMVAFKAHLEERRVKRQAEIMDEYPADMRRDDPHMQREWRRDMVNNNKWHKVTNDALLVQYGKRFPIKSWETKEFIELNKPENAPVKKYYDFIQEVNQLAAESGYIDWDRSKRFLPFMYKTLNEKMVMGGEYSVANSILRALTVSDMDLNYGQVNKITNERYESLPKFFTHETGKEVVDKDGTKRIDYSNTSEDLLANTYLFLTKVVEYDEHTKIEPLAKAMLWLEKNKDSLQTNHLGRVIDGSAPKHDNSKNYEAFKDIVSFQLYNKAYTSKQDMVGREANAGESYNKLAEKVNKFAGFKILSKVEEGGRYSLVKTIDAIKTYQVWKTLGFNISVPFYRFLSIGGQSIIQAGEYYSQRELAQAELRHAGLQFVNKSDSLHVLLMKTFIPVESQLHIEARRMSMSKMTRDTLPDFMMKLTQRAHDWIQYVNFDAMMHNAVVINGKMHNARKYIQASQEYIDRYEGKTFEERKGIERKFEDKVEELIKQHGLIGKAKEVNGKLVIDGLNLKDSSVTKHMNMTRNMGLKLSGNITKENEVNARRNAFIRQFFMYKSWFLGMAETRYTPLSWKEGEQGFVWGRARMCAKIASENIWSSIGRLTSMARATDKGMEHLSKLYEQKKKEYEDEHGKEFKMTKPEFYDLVRKNIAMEFKEITAQVILLSGIIGLYAAVKDIDKDKKGALAFAARLVDRSYEELNMFYNPASMSNLLNGSLLPAMGFPVDLVKALTSTVEYVTGMALGDEKMKKHAKIHKNVARMVPVVSQLPNWLGIIIPEYMKDLGYHPDAKQVHH